MPDLRTLSLEERRALSVEAERRARAGEAPKEIRAALGLSTRAYSAWAKLFGFRQCDLFPRVAHRGAPPKHSPGPGGYARSGQQLRGLPVPDDDARRVYGEDHPAWTGGAAASRARYEQLRRTRRDGRRAAAAAELAEVEDASGLLTRVRLYLEEGETDQADALLSAWRRQQRRDRDLAELEALVEEEATRMKPIEDMTDEEMCAELERLVGRPFRIVD